MYSCSVPPWSFGKQAPLKSRQSSIKLRSATSQNTVIIKSFIFSNTFNYPRILFPKTKQTHYAKSNFRIQNEFLLNYITVLINTLLTLSKSMLNCSISLVVQIKNFRRKRAEILAKILIIALDALQVFQPIRKPYNCHGAIYGVM